MFQIGRDPPAVLQDQLAHSYPDFFSVFIVTTISRLARSVFDLLAIVKRLEAKGVTLRVLDGAIDTSTASG